MKFNALITEGAGFEVQNRMDTMKYDRCIIEKNYNEVDSIPFEIIERYYFEKNNVGHVLIWVNGVKVTEENRFYDFNEDFDHVRREHLKGNKIQKVKYQRHQFLYHGCIQPSKYTARLIKKRRELKVKSTYQSYIIHDRTTGESKVALKKPPRMVFMRITRHGGKF